MYSLASPDSPSRRPSDRLVATVARIALANGRTAVVIVADAADAAAADAVETVAAIAAAGPVVPVWAVPDPVPAAHAPWAAVVPVARGREVLVPVVRAHRAADARAARQPRSVDLRPDEPQRILPRNALFQRDGSAEWTVWGSPSAVAGGDPVLRSCAVQHDGHRREIAWEVSERRRLCRVPEALVPLSRLMEENLRC